MIYLRSKMCTYTLMSRCHFVIVKKAINKIRNLLRGRLRMQRECER